MKIIADTHVHTVASEHAHSTVMENLREAKAKGLRFIAITDHGGSMVGAPSTAYFCCLHASLPDEYDGVYILRGCEVNILNASGELDMPRSVLDGLEWVIASVHSILTPPLSVEDSTELWLNVAKNPSVDVIGHCDEDIYRFDYERVIPEFAKYGKIVELNASSCKTRPSSVKNTLAIARLCAKHGVPIVLSSDAHFAGDVGNVDAVMQTVKDACLPEELILNADAARFAERLTKMTGRAFKV